jgi:vacuolar-type H+-ATPase subunit H
MSESYERDAISGTTVTSGDTPSTMDTAKHEASDLKENAAQHAKDVAATAKSEASSVVQETKHQARELYAQAQREVKDQAHNQQQRLASGLRSASDELGSMAASSSSGGLATDVVREVSNRMAGAASWLGEREPAAVVQEVKRYARRHPATFILAATVAGVVVGRLTRALTANASDQHSGAASPTGSTGAYGSSSAPAALGSSLPVDTTEETPIYARSSADVIDGAGSGVRDDRSDTL